MTALNFPSSPTVGDTYNVGSRTWTWTTSYATTTSRTNLVTNPNFETDVNFWAGGGTGTTALARTTAQAYSGTASLQCTATTAGNIRAYFSGTTGSGSGTGATRIPVTAGQTYTLSAYTRAATTSRSVDVIIEWYNSSDVLFSTVETTEAANSTSAWTRTLTLTETAPVGAVTCVVSVRMFSAVISEVHYIDGVLFENTSTLLPYFDGAYADAYTGYTLTSKSWGGTANASISTGTWGLNSSLNSLWTLNAGALSTGVVGSNELAAGAVTTAKIGANAITATTLASSPTNNYVLTADSSTATGTKWATAQSSGGLTTSTEGAIATMAIGA